jgi:rhamnose utilization protein RhaD (predicted bifunctional aldolase and dehydrogenase)
MALNAQPTEPVDELGTLAALVELSRSFGSDPEMVLAGGGNSSAKVDGHLLVKASGVGLSQIEAENFVDLDRAALQKLLESDLPTSRAEREAEFKQALLAARLSPSTQRPSVESVLHHLMPGKFVVHLHATVVNQFACSRGGRALVEQHLGQDVVWVALVDPGFILAKSLQEELRAFRARTGKERPRAVIMQNHGVVFSGETPDEARAQLDWLLGQLNAIRERTGAPRPGGPDSEGHRGGLREVGARQLRGATGVVALLSSAVSAVVADEPEPPVAVVFDDSGIVIDLVSHESGRDLALGGPVAPDQIVYCRSFPLWVEMPAGEVSATAARRALEVGAIEYRDRYGVAPKVVLVERTGMFTWGATWEEADTVRLVYCDAIKVMRGAELLGGVNHLDEEFRTFIENWELESYRRQRLFGNP